MWLRVTIRIWEPHRVRPFKSVCAYLLKTVIGHLLWHGHVRNFTIPCYLMKEDNCVGREKLCQRNGIVLMGRILSLTVNVCLRFSFFNYGLS